MTAGGSGWWRTTGGFGLWKNHSFNRANRRTPSEPLTADAGDGASGAAREPPCGPFSIGPPPPQMGIACLLHKGRGPFSRPIMRMNREEDMIAKLGGLPGDADRAS